MGLLDKLLKKSSNNIPEQNYKHNVYESEISQYSSLPRFYYITGKRYDIDSPKSVSEIPICATKFKINNEIWGIDTILREHVNRYYSQIPEALKQACYQKISDYNWSEYKTESFAEKEARQKQQEEFAAKEENLRAISLKDMTRFDFNFELQEPFYDNQMSIALVNEADKIKVENDLISLNEYVLQACTISGIKQKLEIPLKELAYDTKIMDAGSAFERTQYYTFFQCDPYTKTGKLSKYPLILHYATENITNFSPEKNYFGHIYYMQDGSIGKCTLIFHEKFIIYVIELFRKGTTLEIKKVEKSKNGIKKPLYKID